MDDLAKLSKKAIPTLMALYKTASYPRHTLTCSALKNFEIQSSKYPEISSNLQLFTLKDDWVKDGLFLIKN